MSSADFSLLTKRRFAPMFVVQFLGAFNDNVLRFGMISLATYTIFQNDDHKAAILASEAAGLFMLMYLLFSAIAGQLADKYDKARLMQIIKGAEVVIMALSVAGFWYQSIPLLMTCLCLMGVHSTIFGPVKYAILPQHLGRDEIMGGTGIIEAGTFLAILGGQLLGMRIEHPWHAGVVALGLAVIGFIAALAIPKAPAPDPKMRITRNPVFATWKVLRMAWAGKGT